jgi:phage shock protein PspC (stress-responsive transcriptional regulator)
VRSREDRRIAGIAGGMAHRLGVTVVFGRAGFLTLIFAYGLGDVVYLIRWAVALDTDATVDQPRAHAVGRTARQCVREW